jgi:hypothetical protein
VNPYYTGGGSSRGSGSRSRDRYFDGRGNAGSYRYRDGGFSNAGSGSNRAERSRDRDRSSTGGSADYRYYASPFYFFGTPFYSPYYYPYDPFGPIYTDAEVQRRQVDEYADEGEYEARPRGNVVLDIFPRDVEVRINDVLTSRSGIAGLNLPSGNYQLEVSRPGYVTWTTDLVVRQGIRYLIEYHLERLPGSREDAPRPAPRLAGELVLDVTPDDAIVNLNGRLLGVVNLLRDGVALRTIPVGRHTVEIRRPGYRPVEREVELGALEPLRLQVALERE